MAMKRPHRRPRGRRAPIDAGLLEFLKDNAQFTYFATDREIRNGWAQIRDDLIASWAEERPGRRPRAWWQFEAKEMRQRLSGTGDAIFEALLPGHEVYYLGIPIRWLQPGYAGPAGAPIDPEDPPIFESEGAYLKRLDLLLPGERKRLAPDDFLPEFVAAEADPDIEDADGTPDEAA